MDYTLERIPAHKVLLGLGIYGRDWSDAGRRTVLWIPSELGSLVSDLNQLKARYNPEINGITKPCSPTLRTLMRKVLPTLSGTKASTV